MYRLSKLRKELAFYCLNRNERGTEVWTGINKSGTRYTVTVHVGKGTCTVHESGVVMSRTMEDVPYADVIGRIDAEGIYCAAND